MADTSDGSLDGQLMTDDPDGRLAAYVARSQTPLDLLALVTLWLVVVQPEYFDGDARTVAVIVRLLLSGIYGIDLFIRAQLSSRHWHYVRTHWLSLVVVVLPPLRVIFSLRLVKSMFQRGHLSRFLMAAGLLVVNGAIVVYLFERHAAGGNIHTLGQSIWWSATTVSTVGYGEYYPVTGPGEIAAAFIMVVGIVTLAVVTAQVASGFIDQAARRRVADIAAPPVPPNPTTDSSLDGATLADVAQRLARIEELLLSSR